MVGLLPDHALLPTDDLVWAETAVSLARALIMSPRIIVADETFSMLDSVRSQIINLLLKLQEELGIAYVIVANDLGLVRHISDKVIVMHQGRVVETGTTQSVFANPQTRGHQAADPKLWARISSSSVLACGSQAADPCHQQPPATLLRTFGNCAETNAESSWICAGSAFRAAM